MFHAAAHQGGGHNHDVYAPVELARRRDENILVVGEAIRPPRRQGLDLVDMQAAEQGQINRGGLAPRLDHAPDTRRMPLGL